MSGDRIPPVSAEDLDWLITTLDADSKRAEEIFAAFRQRLLTVFRFNGVWGSDAEALVHETFLIAKRSRTQTQVHNLPAFINGIARNLAHEKHRERKRTLSLDELPEQREQPCPDQLETERKDYAFDCLDQCLQQLNEDERSLILEYSNSKKTASRRKIAIDLGKNPGTLRVQTFRIRQKLERCVRHCMTVAECNKTGQKSL